MSPVRLAYRLGTVAATGDVVMKRLPSLRWRAYRALCGIVADLGVLWLIIWWLVG
jgi:hypothetical protein